MSHDAARLNAALEGRYAVEGEIGEGGMATVYLARDLKHNRNVALKVLMPELAAVVGAERFLAEIETTANLQHPHILPLFDSGEADGFLFYVMPYIEGETLRERIDREKQLPVDDALYIATSVANALQVAHSHGVVHRDIKPGNILLSAGEPLVSDFGIAIAIGAAGGNRLTETGLSVGTPYYMSPEQATGDQEVGPATDIYALACVLYEMLVGEPPYMGSTAQAVLGRIIQGVPVSATATRKSVPPNVDAAIRRALEKLPADRFTHAGDFAKALADQSFRWGEAAGAVEAERTFWKPLAIGMGAVAALSSVGLGWSLTRPEPLPPVSREVIMPETFEVSGPIGRYAALAPDGSSMVVPVVTDDGVQLGLRTRSSLEVRPIPGTESGRDLQYSPDGSWIAYAVERRLLARPLVGGSTVTLAEDVDDQIVGLTWLEDGTIVYEGESGDPLTSPLVRIPEDGGEPLGIVFEEGEADQRLTPIWVEPLPGPRGLLVVVCPVACTQESWLHVVDLRDAGGATRVLDEVLRAWYVDTGHVVYVRRDGAVLAAPFDLGDLSLSGTGTPLFEGVRVATGGRADMLLGRDGTLLYVEGGAVSEVRNTELVWVDRAGRQEPVDPGLELHRYLTVALSPDDSRLAVDIQGDSRDIWVKELPEGPLTRLTTDSFVERRPVWSRDGSTIAYLTNADGYHMRTVRSDGSSIGDFDVLVQRERDVFEIAYTPDELGLIFREGNANAGDADMGFLDLETGEANDALLASRFNERAIALSPDGRWLAYVSDVTGRDEVFVRPFPDTGSGQRQVSSNGGIEPMWAHNGRELFYRRGPDGPMMVATYEAPEDFEVTSRQELFDASPYLAGEGLSWHSYDVTSDDERFIMVRPIGEEVEGEAGRLVLVRNWFTELRQRLD